MMSGAMSALRLGNAWWCDGVCSGWQSQSPEMNSLNGPETGMTMGLR